MKKLTKRLFAIAMMIALMIVLPALAMAEPVARIGNVEYDSIRAAVLAAESGNTIVVIKDHNIDFNAESESTQITTVKVDGKNLSLNALIPVSGKAVTVDLNGCKVTGTVDCEDWFTLFAVIPSDSQLTIKDSLGDGGFDITAKTDVVYALLLNYDATGSSSLTIDGGSYRVDQVNASGSLIYSQGNETVTVNGGSFHLGNVATGKNGSPWIFNAKGQNTAHVIVNGGTYNDDILHQYYPFEVSAPETKALHDNGNGTWTVVDAAAYLTEREWSSAWYTNNIGYETLNDALGAMEAIRTRSSQTSEAEIIYALKNCTEKETLTVSADAKNGDAAKDAVIELNGHTIVWEGSLSAPIIRVEEGSSLTIDKFEPTRSDYVFAGWYTDAALSTPFESTDSPMVLTGPVELYGKWTPAATPTPAPTSTPKPTPVPTALPSPTPIPGEPAADVPQTGDNSPLMLFAALMALSAAGLLFLRKRSFR